jgi:hypothetical protein
MIHFVNYRAPKAQEQLQMIIPENALVITTESNSIVRGAMNTFRSMRSGPTLLNVPVDDIGICLNKFEDYQDNTYIVTQDKLDKLEYTEEYIFKNKGLFYKGWVNSIKALIKNPWYEKRTTYYVYYYEKTDS